MKIYQQHMLKIRKSWDFIVMHYHYLKDKEQSKSLNEQ